MTSGLIGIRFKPGTQEDEIQAAISKFYEINTDLICGMQYLEFDKHEIVDHSMKQAERM